MSLDRFENFVIDHETLVQLAEACKAYRRMCGTSGNWYGIQDMSCVNAPGRQWYLRIVSLVPDEEECCQCRQPDNISRLTEFAGPWASAEDCFYAATKAEWLVAQDSDTVEHIDEEVQDYLNNHGQGNMDEHPNQDEIDYFNDSPPGTV